MANNWNRYRGSLRFSASGAMRRKFSRYFSWLSLKLIRKTPLLDSLLEDEPDIDEAWSEVERAIDDGTYSDDLLTLALHSGTRPPPQLAIKLEGYLQTRHDEGKNHDKKRASRQRKRKAATDVELAMRKRKAGTFVEPAMRMGGKYCEAMDKAMKESGLSERTIQALRAKIYPKMK